MRGIKANLLNEFPTQIEILKELFGEKEVNLKLKRLNHIYETTERRWYENLKRLEGIPVKYLLIAEAPPWSDEGEEVQYFYNTFNGP